jgi:dynein heavy chain 1
MIWLQLGVWLVMFCDEINLPDMDAYGTQRVISFLRQMVEHNGFYRSADCQSAVLRIQIRDPVPF